MNACTHGMPSPFSCIDCMEEGNIPKRVPEIDSIEYRFTARYEGSYCNECNLPIMVGHFATKMSTGRVIHSECTP